MCVVCLFCLGFVLFSVCLSGVCYSTNEVSTTTAYMLAPAEFRGGSNGARGGFARSNCSNLLHHRVGWTWQNPPRPIGNPPQPARSNVRLPIFQPLEAEFEKVVFSKVVALAMFYLVTFEN